MTWTAPLLMSKRIYSPFCSNLCILAFNFILLTTNEKSLPQAGEGTAEGQLLFADLVAYCAGSLASRLAGCLALAAAARLQGLLHGRLVDRLDVLHS